MYFSRFSRSPLLRSSFRKSDFVCPLCCEDFDISDREFYPCKCGYQVCMWCWHRIRESDSGNCPACRTPYGEDPHQFSAVDVEEVLKANKEKEAAAKRERQRGLQEEPTLVLLSTGTSSSSAAGALGSSSHAVTSAAVSAAAASAAGSGPSLSSSSSSSAIEAPKDRSLLANMRVIRRNLVYAVGLPPHAATEEILKRPEYFGQYGKLAKVVINRAQVTAAALAAGGGGESRRASASAYVTFVHKEDALACILALDGYNLDGRNLRASYGTSKYCSAFIKNVRCNNPECTYLHEMGSPDDTFTKQEIQAGYVTSGRDVLARQLQIVAEQMRLGHAASLPKKRVGGGGPSGTGRAAANPVLPPPEYDEPSKQSPPLVPPPAGVARSVTASATSLNPANIAAKLGRSSSIGVAIPPVGGSSGNRSPIIGSSLPGPAAAHRKSHSAALTATTTSAHRGSATTAAAVVAGGRSTLKPDPSADAHATLTPLTPLKRTNGKAPSRAVSVGATAPSESSYEKPSPLRGGAAKKQNGIVNRATSIGAMSGAPSMPAAQSNPSGTSAGTSAYLNSIGGDVIGPPTLKPRSANHISGLSGDLMGPSAAPKVEQSSSFGGIPIGVSGLSSSIGLSASDSCDSLTRSSALGGEVFTGPLPSSNKSAVGSNSHKWNGGSAGQIGSANQYTGSIPFGNGPSLMDGSNGGYSLAGSSGAGSLAIGGIPVGGSVIGPRSSSAVDDRYPTNSGGFDGNSSSTLASILGVSLPTGSGSLQESSFWPSGFNNQAPSPSPLSALNGSSIPSNDYFGNHRVPANSGSALIGGLPIGGVPVGGSAQSSCIGGSGSSMSDIALLQSLLPGVHITSGTDSTGFNSLGNGVRGSMGGWAHPPPGPSSMGLGPTSLQGEPLSGGWTGGMSHSSESSMGAIGQNVGGPQGQRRGPGIW